MSILSEAIRAATDRNVCPAIRGRLRSAFNLLRFIAAGCAVLSKPPEIPEEALKKAATAIERAVLADAGSAITLKDEPEFKVRTTEIERAVRSRQSRIGIVAEFKQKGYVGEGVRGLLRYVKNPECDTDARLHARVANVILSENADRWRIYEALARENHLSGSGRKHIQAIFHQVRIEVARPGDLLQLTPGAPWTKKTDAESP